MVSPDATLVRPPKVSRVRSNPDVEILLWRPHPGDSAPLDDQWRLPLRPSRSERRVGNPCESGVLGTRGSV